MNIQQISIDWLIEVILSHLHFAPNVLFSLFQLLVFHVATMATQRRSLVAPASSRYRGEEGSLYLTDQRIIFHSPSLDPSKPEKKMVFAAMEVKGYTIMENTNLIMFTLQARIKGAVRDLDFHFVGPNARDDRNLWAAAITKLVAENKIIVNPEPGLGLPGLALPPLAAPPTIAPASPPPISSTLLALDANGPLDAKGSPQERSMKRNRNKRPTCVAPSRLTSSSQVSVMFYSILFCFYL